MYKCFQDALPGLFRAGCIAMARAHWKMSVSPCNYQSENEDASRIK